MKKAIGLFVFAVLAVFIFAFLSQTVLGTIFRAQGGVFVSKDGGENWDLLGNTTGQEDVERADIMSFKVNRQDTSIIYMGTRSDSLYKSTNSGRIWTKIADRNEILSPSATVYDIEINPVNSQDIYISVVQGGKARILRSENGGESFVQVYSAAKNSLPIYDIELDPNRAGIIWAGGGETVLLRSKDFGQHWEKVNEFEGRISFILLNPTSSQDVFIVTVDRGIFQTTNGGSNWQDLTAGLDGFAQAQFIESARRDPHRPSTIYLASRTGLLRSQDNGSSWSLVKLIIPTGSLAVQDVGFSRQDSSALFALADNNLYSSRNSGQTWRIEVLPSNKGDYIFNIDPQNDSVIYLGTR